MLIKVPAIISMKVIDSIEIMLLLIKLKEKLLTRRNKTNLLQVNVD